MIMAPTKISERTKRPCKHCSKEIYLQYIPVTPTLKWISFDLDEKLHLCAARPLQLKTEQLIQEAIDRINYSNTNEVSPLLNNIDISS